MNIDRLTCIDLDLPGMEGFRKFISSWLVRCDGFTALVDPGPLSTVPRLLEELGRQSVDRVDYILLTHIHIDHAGGTGAVLSRYPDARVVCHPEGIRHMTAPEKLWQGTQKVLGELAEIYGEIVAVPESSIIFEETIGTTGIRAFLTPGHAQHHVSYLLGDLLFAGEVAGVRSDVPDGIFMRPATPPRFVLEVALDSLDRMIEVAPGAMVFAHYGLVDNALEHLRIGRQQLLLWVCAAARTFGMESPAREEAILAWLLEHDRHYRNVALLPDDLRARERYFVGNTLRGMIEYVDALQPEERARLAEPPARA